MKVDLTKDEVKALYELGRYALQSRQAQSDPEARPLIGAMTKLQRSARDMMCRHCKERLASRRDKICDPCHQYRRKYNRLPANRTLVNRWLRV